VRGESAAVSAYVVVFSVEDRSSFSAAIDHLYEIRRETAGAEHATPTTSSPAVTNSNTYHHRPPAVILVANKVDLVRNREVLEQGILPVYQWGFHNKLVLRIFSIYLSEMSLVINVLLV